MKQTVDVQKDMMKNMSIDQIQDLMDDMRDLQEDQEEINEAFTRNYEVDVEDGELDAELDELDYQMRFELDTKDLTVPNKRVATKKEADEKELEDMLK